MHGLWMKWLRQEKQQESQIGKTNHDKGYKDLIWFNTVNGIGMNTNKTNKTQSQTWRSQKI